MLFEITRASQNWDKRPCKETIAKEGKWFIQIKSIEHLAHFVSKYGKVIFNGNKIIIYDDYVE